MEAVRKAGEESPTRLICLTNTAGAATRPLPPVRSLSYLRSIPGRERLPRSGSRRENRVGDDGAESSRDRRKSCRYIISTLFIFPIFWFDPQFMKDPSVLFQRRASEWFVFRYGSHPPPTPLAFFEAVILSLVHTSVMKLAL